MKDKLRELAERWMRLSQAAGSSLYEECAAELISILDAEGDGGAVDFVCPGYLAALSDAFHYLKGGERDFQAQKLNELHTLLASSPVYTHPARSGVVRDEDVEAACKIYVSSGGGSEVNNYVRVNMRAALEHFAKRTDEDVRDAERYRWLRGRMFVQRNAAVPDRYGLDKYLLAEGITEPRDSKYIDAAIDAAIQGESA